MQQYLLIESSGPQAGPGGERFVADAAALAGHGAQVALFLVENGVAGALPPAIRGLAEFLGNGGQLWVDAFSLRQRALAEADLVAGARMADMGDLAARLLTPGVRAVWH